MTKCWFVCEPKNLQMHTLATQILNNQNMRANEFCGARTDATANAQFNKLHEFERQIPKAKKKH